MKSKKSLLSLGILALVLVLGVGYAVVSTVTLSFSGTAKGVSEADLKVEIGTITPESTDKHGYSATTKSVNFTVFDMTLEEEVTFNIEILNKEKDIDATLEDVADSITNSNSEYFEVSHSITNATIPAKGSTTVELTVKMIKTPVTNESNQTEFGFTLNAKPIDNKKNND